MECHGFITSDCRFPRVGFVYFLAWRRFFGGLIFDMIYRVFRVDDTGTRPYKPPNLGTVPLTRLSTHYTVGHKYLG